MVSEMRFRVLMVLQRGCFCNEVKNNIITVHAGELKLGAFAGETIDVNGTEKTVKASIASIINSDLTVKADGTLKIGTNGNEDSVVIDADSTLTVENGGIVAFEENASVDIDGAFLATDATMFLELSDYIADLDAGGTVDLDWTIATFEDETAAQNALAGFTNFENDLGIEKGTELSDGLWFNVKQEGTELKVVGVIPEPATMSLIGLMGGAMLIIRRRFS